MRTQFFLFVSQRLLYSYIPYKEYNKINILQLVVLGTPKSGIEKQTRSLLFSIPDPIRLWYIIVYFRMS